MTLSAPRQSTATEVGPVNVQWISSAAKARGATSARAHTGSTRRSVPWMRERADVVGEAVIGNTRRIGVVRRRSAGRMGSRARDRDAKGGDAAQALMRPGRNAAHAGLFGVESQYLERRAAAPSPRPIVRFHARRI